MCFEGYRARAAQCINLCLQKFPMSFRFPWGRDHLCFAVVGGGPGNPINQGHLLSYMNLLSRNEMKGWKKEV